MSKPQSNDNDDSNDNEDDEDTMIASTSKNHDNHDVVFFAPVVVVVAAGDNSGTRPCRRPLTLMPLRISCQHAWRRRGKDPLLSKLRSYNDSIDNDNNNDDKDAIREEVVAQQLLMVNPS